ncbi:hypothetical protein PCA20602_01941 [Pandoraea capi]|uniref:Uncharacterized protein n=1 Tax=Pandoraea capi TaxID=2508286 RepID=A0ABY6W451_9BURK|nr:hypothetical protein PCA20602_01941 [Pandoraea capi]
MPYERDRWGSRGRGNHSPSARPPVTSQPSPYAHRRAHAPFPLHDASQARERIVAHRATGSLRHLPATGVEANLRGVRGCLRRCASRCFDALLPVRHCIAAADVVPGGNGRARPGKCDNLSHPDHHPVRPLSATPASVRCDADARRLRATARYFDDSSEIPRCSAVSARIRRAPWRRSGEPRSRRRGAIVGARATGTFPARVARVQSGVGARSCGLTPGASVCEYANAAQRPYDCRSATAFPRRTAAQSA